MSNTASNNRKLAAFLAENTEKEKIIAAVFDFFKLDCLERCNMNPSGLDEMIRRFDSAPECDIELLASIIETVQIGKESAKKKQNELIRKIVAYISENRFSDISVEEIAKELNISYYYMCHIFKDKYNVSVNTFRTQKRLEIAMRKLVESDEKISEIATSCGFDNVSYFTETFSKMVGVTPTEFRAANRNVCFHDFYEFHDMLLATKLQNVRFLDERFAESDAEVKSVLVYEPNDRFKFLHEAAIIEYRGVLYASWYNNPITELQGYTPICGRRSYDWGKTWTELEIISHDETEKILYCPPVYGICDDKLYLLMNQMVAPDHIHALDLYVLNNETEKFELLWSRPIPFKLNTNVVTLPNGKLMLPGRVGELDGFPNTPAVLISDSGKIDAPWRLVKIAENGNLPDGKKFVFPELSVMRVDNTLLMFCRNDQRMVPIVYLSTDFGETWSAPCSHDVPYIPSKIYAGNLSDGRKYLIANVDVTGRSKLAVYFTDADGGKFIKRKVLFYKDTSHISGAAQDREASCCYPAACEADGKLYIIATLRYVGGERGAVLYTVDLNEI